MTLDQPAAVWAALLQRVESVSAFAWVDRVELAGIDASAGVCKVRPRQGQRDIAGFVTPRQCDRLAAELTKLTAKRCRIQLVDAQPGAHAGAEANASQPNNRSGIAERRQALELPLVKDVIDVFPEAVLIDARHEANKPEDEGKD